MRKLISALLALVMVLSMATVAFAAVDTTGWQSEENSESYKLNKIYTVIGTHGNELIVPQETLKFEVKALTEGAPAVTVADLKAADLTKGEDGKITGVMNITIPSTTKVGVYQYEVSEKAGNGQAVTYSDAVVAFSVLVSYDYEAKNLKAELILTTGTKDNKLDDYENKYELGHMSVTKTVDGNLADKSVEFEMTVTLKSANPVLSTITVADGNQSSGTTTSIAPADWKESDNGYEAVANIKVSDTETVNLYNIPAGVTYTVEEAAKHGLEGGQLDVNSTGDTDYTVTYTNEKGTIAVNETKAASVLNEKSTTVETGITMDSVPFVLMLAVCAVAAVMFVIKRRSVEF